MFWYKALTVFLAMLLKVANTSEDLPNVIIGDPYHASADIVGPPISEAEFEAALADDSLLTYQPSGNSPLTSQSTFFQGDIQLKSKDQLIEIMLNKVNSVQRSAISNSRLKWTNAQIPYRISSSFTAHERGIIARAMAEYHQQTCIKFIPRNKHRNYIHILKGIGCSSAIGCVGGAQTVSLEDGCVRFGTVIHELLKVATLLCRCSSAIGCVGGAQTVSLEDGCVQFGTVIHELMHVAGFWHEQSRYDRDEYVIINRRNIIPGMAYNFNKNTPSVSQDLGLPYDYSSVMHYSKFAFAKDTRIPTIYPRKKGEKIIGNREGFSKLDIKGLNLLYMCDDMVKPVKPSSPVVPVKPSSNCVDTRDFCSSWAKMGQCEINHPYMNLFCRKTCGKCN